MRRLFAYLVSLLFMAALAAAGGVLAALWHFGRGLPDYSQLADYQPPVVTRVHAGDGRLLAQYATERRVFVPIDAMPKRVIKAFLAAEDKNFYSHPGVDVMSIVRAAMQNVSNLGANRRPVGASTITQQVAKNFLLTNEVSIERKIKEAILAFRIEKALSKDRILELYLNEIYLGFQSYGVAAAALNYFNTSLDNLTLAEAAYLAALPKAPNNYNPLRNPGAAQGRRDWVIDRMLEAGFVRPEEAQTAKAEAIVIRRRDETESVSADYFAEEVRRELVQRFGERGVYGGGLSVHATVDPRLQAIADRALRAGLIAYDRRHGWRGPLARIDAGGAWRDRLRQHPPIAGQNEWRLAAVLGTERESASIGFADGSQGRIPLAELRWARETREDQRIGPAIERASQALSAGDVVLVEPVDADPQGRPYPPDSYGLRQIPNVGGALITLDPHTGRILAMSGGYSFEISQFNRAVQAQRQPGSSFKTFAYLAALDSGYTPATIVDDAPIALEQGPGLPLWRPLNYSGRFYGPSTLRSGLEKSRNVMTVRIVADIGIERVAEYAETFGITPNMPRYMSMALGANSTTLLRMTTAYAMLVNGGKRITPSLIDRVQDRNGRTVYRHDVRPCPDCREVAWQHQAPPRPPDTRAQVGDPVSVYQTVAMLQGVAERGTAARLRELRRPLAGKTGTTNDFHDAWFIGFTPDLAVGVYIGFDQPRTLGSGEAGASAALPIFQQFMAEALAGSPAVPFRIPPGVRLVRIHAESGRLPRPGDRGVILEAFRSGTEPGADPTAVAGEPAARGPTAGSGIY